MCLLAVDYEGCWELVANLPSQGIDREWTGYLYSATTFVREEPTLLPYIGPEFAQMLARHRPITEASSSDEAVAQGHPDKTKASEVPYGPLRVALVKLFIVTFQVAVRWLL